MDFDALRWRTRELVGLQAADQLDPRDVDRFLNEAYLEYVNLEDWPFRYVTQAIATVDGDFSYDLTSPLRHVRTVYNTGDDIRYGRLRERAPQVMVDAERTDGRPTEYALVDVDTIELFPTPDGVYNLTVQGVRAVPELTLETDVPMFDSDFHVGICYLAASAVLVREDPKDPRIERFQAEASAYLDRMRRRYLHDHDEGLIVLGARHNPRRRWVGR